MNLKSHGTFGNESGEYVLAHMEMILGRHMNESWEWVMARMRMHRGIMLQCVVVCCSVRQCMCFNVLQRVVVLQ